jgi:putative phosphotransacetylase
MASTDRTIPVALSARHVHLSQEHVERLFGAGYALAKLSDLSQPGQFAGRETVEVMGPKRSIPGVRVLGPARGESQLEISMTDGYLLGINVPVRVSGDIAGTPGVHLIGPRGAVRLERGCICAARHIHCTPADAGRFGVKDRQKVFARLAGPRGLILDEIIVRVSENFFTELHIDTDEGNAAGVKSGDRVEIIGSLCRDFCGREACTIRSDLGQGGSAPYCDLTATGVTIR